MPAYVYYMQRKGVIHIKNVMTYFEQHHGYARMRELKTAGFQTRDIRALLETGSIVKIKPGLYRLATLQATESSGLVEVCLAHPKAVICLTSALSLHELTTFVPTRIAYAIPRASKPVELGQWGMRAYYFSENQYHAGIEHRNTSSGPIRIYDPEKSICDMFRFKDTLGSDLAFEVLKNYLGQRKRNLTSLMAYAAICRVKHEMSHYVKAILG